MNLSDPMHGFLNLDKPSGLTSHDCVAKVRKLLKQKRVGHGGTLDPAATGVLPIAIGKATRLLQYLSHQKSYRARIRFGLVTTTDDLEGEVVSQQPVPHLTLAEVQNQLPNFEGSIDQIPPSFSAIQVGGKRLYELARAGQLVEAPLRSVEVYRIDVLNWQVGDYPELELAIDCGTGTYIRSIARDLGVALGTGGTLAALIRTASSGFDQADSLTLEQLTDQIQTQTFTPIPPAAALKHLPVIQISDAQTRRWRQGQRLDWDTLPEPAMELQPDPPTVCQIQDAAHHFLGMGQAVETQGDRLLVPKLVWDAD